MKDSFYRIFTAVCIIVTLVCSFYLFSQRFCFLSMGLSYDELYSAATSNPDLSLIFIWKNMLLRDINFPLFNILLYGWNHIFPYTVPYLRLFSALGGALAVLASWAFIPKNWPKMQKFIFIALLASTPVLIAYGINVRAYSWTVFASTIFTLLSLQIIEGIISNCAVSTKTWLIFFIVGLFGSCLHYFCAAVFFITALIIFIYSLYYKNHRAWIFWGTIVAFCLWIAWPIYAWNFADMSHAGGAKWWFGTPLIRASWDILTFLFGSLRMIQGLVFLLVLSFVSMIFTYKVSILKKISFMVPLLQIIFLVIVVSILSFRINLWLDRYFLPVMPAVIILISSCLYHLQERHRILLSIVPIILVTLVNYFWQLDYLRTPELTGIKDSINYITSKPNVDQVLVDFTKSGYSREGMINMFNFYLQGKPPIEIIELTPDSVSLAFSKKRIPVLIPLCYQIHLINSSLEMGFDWDSHPLLFGKDVCILEQIHPISVANREHPRIV